MDYISVKQTAEKWNISERSVRNYCAEGRVFGALLDGKKWLIPADAEKPSRAKRSDAAGSVLAEILQKEMKAKLSGGIYHRVQIDLTYNSNHIEGSRLTRDQTRYIFETNTVGLSNEAVSVDDIIETTNHFRCVDMVIADYRAELSEKLIRELHAVLKSGTSDSRLAWFAVGQYKRFPNEVGGMQTASPEETAEKMQALLESYNGKKEKGLDELLDFHAAFERIHPFQDGNGRIGRLILFKECLKYNVVPFIIGDDLKMYYYRGLSQWGAENGYLRDTALTAQDRFKKYLDYFRISYKE